VPEKTPAGRRRHKTILDAIIGFPQVALLEYVQQDEVARRPGLQRPFPMRSQIGTPGAAKKMSLSLLGQEAESFGRVQGD
jgi:hypothetical protein